jgi:hypothetical protein
MSRESMTRIYPRRRIKSSEGNPIDSVVYGASDNHIVGPATGHGGQLVGLIILSSVKPHSEHL